MLKQDEVFSRCSASSKLCDVLKKSGLESIHVNSLPEGDETPDEEIISFAHEKDFIIISKDIDFYHSHMLHNKPPKLHLITTGNIKNRDLFNLVSMKIETIITLFESCDYLEVSIFGIMGHRVE